MQRKINFDRDGVTLVGNLFTPDDLDENGRHPAVIVQGSFTSVKEQMAGTYAERFAGQGFVALSFDYAHYGESEGQPRQYESPAEKLFDLQAAVTYLTGLPYVQAVGMVGVCTSAGARTFLPRSSSSSTTFKGRACDGRICGAGHRRSAGALRGSTVSETRVMRPSSAWLATGEGLDVPVGGVLPFPPGRVPPACTWTARACPCP
ncbi:alpha/beta hydrolase [Streptomyces luteogriseus]|uniref:alpha/beta hydrolase n=1 Tax=Streptomyces luteogriseus TaxID=68233 RepID=UPI00382874EA